MLRKFVEKNHYLFVDEISTWQEAIKLSCKPLEKDNTVDENYADEIIRCVTKYGPYIVLMPNVAMPHSTEGAEGVNKTAISFMRVEKPVSFDPEDREKDAQLFFTLASCNSEEHLKNMQELSVILSNEGLVEELARVKTPGELLKLQGKYIDSQLGYQHNQED